MSAQNVKWHRTVDKTPDDLSQVLGYYISDPRLRRGETVGINWKPQCIVVRRVGDVYYNSHSDRLPPPALWTKLDALSKSAVETVQAYINLAAEAVE